MFATALLMLGSLVSQTDNEVQSCIKHVNHARKQAGLNELVVDAKLMQTSQSWSNSQQRRGRMSHGPHTGWSGECVAWGASTGHDVFGMWWRSPGHHNIMMGRGARKIGVGRAGTFWTLQTGH